MRAQGWLATMSTIDEIDKNTRNKIGRYQLKIYTSSGLEGNKIIEYITDNLQKYSVQNKKDIESKQILTVW